jgi:hypothetical protein
MITFNKKRENLATMKILARILYAVFAITILTACVTTKTKKSGPYDTNVTVPANKAHEDCFKLALGQPVDFAFKSSVAMDFNLHCHEEGEVIYPIDLKGVSEHSGTFVADREQYWCLMWENKSSREVSLSYEFTVGDK